MDFGPTVYHDTVDAASTKLAIRYSTANIVSGTTIQPWPLHPSESVVT